MGIRTLYMFQICVALLLGAACTDGGVVAPFASQLKPSGTTSQVPPAPSTTLTLDEEFVSVATAFPSFGGLYVDADSVTVVVTDLTTASVAAEQAAGLFFARHQGELRTAAALPRKVLLGTYDFANLASLRDLYLKSGISTRVASLDVDERRNRVVVGVRVAADTAVVAQQLGRLGLPLDAFIVEPDEPPTPTSLLIDAQRPVVAGLGIWFYKSTGDLAQCSLAWNVYRRSGGSVDSSTRYFMTASHCGTTYGVGIMESTVYHQGSPVSSADSLGQESYDPGTYTGGNCPAGWQCRYSDASLGTYAPAIMWRHGGLGTSDFAPPPGFPTYWGYVMAAVGGTAGSGYWAIGSTSGSKGNGVLKKSCYDRAWGPVPYNIWMKCQSQINLPAYQGDSGGAVYLPDYYFPSSAAVPVGLRWAGDLVNGGRSDYSPISGIEHDLGQLQFLSTCSIFCFGTFN